VVSVMVVVRVIDVGVAASVAALVEFLSLVRWSPFLLSMLALLLL